MALINCPDCDAKVSSEAPSCLQCGRPIKKSTAAPAAPVSSEPQRVVVVEGKKRTSLLTWLVALIAFFWLVGYIQRKNWEAKEGAPGQPVKAAEAAASKQTIYVSPGDLLSRYQANEVRTNDWLEGKMIKSSGSVRELSEMLGKPIIKIDTGVKYHELSAFVDPQQRSSVSGLSVGSEVTVICDRASFILSDPALYGCTIQ